MKNNKIKKILLIIVLVIGMGILTYSGFKLYEWYKDYSHTNKISDDLSDTPISENNGKSVIDENTVSSDDPYWKYISIPLMSVNFDELKTINKDTVGWLRVENSNINYPVVQAKDNAYYLRRSFDKKYNAAGWVFMDYTNNAVYFDRNTVIYGHARRDKTMFGTLRNIVNRNWYNNTENHIVKLSTPYEDTLWQVFSVYTIKSENYYIQTKFFDESSYQEWLNTMVKRSRFNFKTTLGVDDQVLTLSSCYSSDNIRVVLHAKLIKKSIRNMVY